MHRTKKREIFEYYDTDRGKWINVTSEPVFNEQGAIDRAIHILRDVTDRKKLEATLAQSQKMESLGTLAGGIAHEFNNILGIILGNTDLALDDLADRSQARNSVQEVRTAALRAKKVVQQIQRFVRKIPSEKQPGKISTMVDDALKLLRSTIPSTVIITHDIGCPFDLVLASPTEINQVLINLCTNAVHAMPDGCGALDVGLNSIVLDQQSAARYENIIPGNYVKLTITDDGSGIDTAIMDRIFEPYFTTKDVSKGVGMGLSVVYGIVKNHDGYIGVRSEAGVGTTVEVLLPTTATRDHPVETENANMMAEGTERILFVDDEPAIVKLAQQILERMGYQVVGETQSAKALDRFEAAPERFDLVITDMAMPQMAGDELARALIQIRPDIPIMLCTGFSDHMDLERAKALGIASFVMKPLDRKTFARQVRKVLDVQDEEKA